VSSSGSPTLIIETGPIDDHAPAVSVNGSTITFVYTITPGDSNLDLDYSSVNSIYIPAGSWIKRDSALPTVDVKKLLPEPNSKGSLSFNKNIRVDTNPPTVKSISTT
jgi:hypothetical protein